MVPKDALLFLANVMAPCRAGVLVPEQLLNRRVMGWVDLEVVMRGQMAELLRGQLDADVLPHDALHGTAQALRRDRPVSRAASRE